MSRSLGAHTPIGACVRARPFVSKCLLSQYPLAVTIYAVCYNTCLLLQRNLAPVPLCTLPPPIAGPHAPPSSQAAVAAPTSRVAKAMGGSFCARTHARENSPRETDEQTMGGTGGAETCVIQLLPKQMQPPTAWDSPARAPSAARLCRLHGLVHAHVHAHVTLAHRLVNGHAFGLRYIHLHCCCPCHMHTKLDQNGRVRTDAS